MRARHGFALKLALLLTIFVCVPAVLYGHFRTADQDKQQLILKAAQERGRMTLDVISPLLGTFDPGTAGRIGTMLSRMGSAETQIRVLFRPANLSETDRFYYIASAPEVSATYLDAERKELVETGIFRRVPASCMRLSPTAARYTNPAGKEELLVSLHSVNTLAGCWVVITSTAAAEFLGTGIGRSYWQTPEMRLAIIIYLFMAACVVMIFLDVWSSIRGFSNHARKVRTQNGNAETFAAHNQVPELDGVAGEFDRMVGSLRHSAQMIRFMAEDNAHAFKTPIAVIAQSLEPVKRSVSVDDVRTRRSLEMIEHSVHRLDSLVSAARRMDEAAADIVDPMREAVDIAQLMRRIGDDYAESLAGRGIDVRVEATSPMTLFAQQDLLETVLENLLENAASFTPQGGKIRLFAEKRGGTAVLRVEDEGQGVGVYLRSVLFQPGSGRHDRWLRAGLGTFWRRSLDRPPQCRGDWRHGDGRKPAGRRVRNSFGTASRSLDKKNQEGIQASPDASVMGRGHKNVLQIAPPDHAFTPIFRECKTGGEQATMTIIERLPLIQDLVSDSSVPDMTPAGPVKNALTDFDIERVVWDSEYREAIMRLLNVPLPD